ncbi:MAG: SRPBCC domain-containing protein [Gammaproteobacteria bacterium]|nr:SRPBCC domain-containing protein [Gammaproteobacteria bacterium]MDH3369811.1 SRPBCC domain-containing protein [Gammaproteobacteria bacterium]MDH3406743.1 SRPBCC domain-containing protein [Gammaproteobacteria bacterium]MDH3563679.1 SRPBCC domain-containing protein [Gammaproteobacteria bacterium]MDH5486715.1 SRPBCC domain-containing protein [Gammaproteobacteria bacterium]
MPTIKSAIDIGTSAEIVWRVLTDFNAYPHWNPFLISVFGPPVPGQRLKIQARYPRGDTVEFTARVVKSIPAAELRWRRRRIIEGIFDREQAFFIVPNGIKGVRFIQREHFSGMLVSLIMPFITDKTHKAFSMMNLALKRTAEAKR